MAGPTLLIGGMGFIGLHTARRFLDQGQDVVITYHANRREPDFLQNDLGTRAKVEQLDVLNADRVAEIIKTHDVEGVVYLAVPSLAGVSPAEEFQTNTQGYLNVLEASRAAGVRRLSVTSSVAIYSNVTQRPWTEDLTVSTVSTNPTEAYKKALEVLGLYFGSRTGLDVVMLR
ncbi:MAG TPA: NAD-dependent epimerase/dehydratase family protein, partial [Chloroflexota bacterium]